MATLPTARVTDTYFVVYDADAFIGDFAAHRAIQEWVRKHGLDPAEVSMHGPLHRDEEHCRVVYVGRDSGERPNTWTMRLRQGETPPMPWPAELDRYRVPV
jgi:hypothetical protein